MAERVLRDADAAGLGDAFEPRGNIYAIAVDVAVFDDDIAEMHADPEGDTFLLRGRAVALGHRALHGDSAGDRLDHTRELDQESVAGCLDDPAFMAGDLRIEKLAAQPVEAFERAFLVRPHQPRIPGHIGGEDRGETAGLAHSTSPAANRRPDKNNSRCSGCWSIVDLGITTLVIPFSRWSVARASSSRPICA